MKCKNCHKEVQYEGMMLVRRDKRMNRVDCIDPKGHALPDPLVCPKCGTSEFTLPGKVPAFRCLHILPGGDELDGDFLFDSRDFEPDHPSYVVAVCDDCEIRLKLSEDAQSLVEVT